MNNLHRELAPISDSAWAQIEEEASRTLKRYLAGRPALSYLPSVPAICRTSRRRATASSPGSAR